MSVVPTPARSFSSLDRRGNRLDLRPVQPLLDRIVSHWHPQEVWLFGSRARGTAAPDSDWDLLVVVPDATASADFDHPMTIWRVKQGSGVCADVVLCLASEFEEDRSTHNTIVYDASVEGVRIA